jgi:hypothetical protein
MEHLRIVALTSAADAVIITWFRDQEGVLDRAPPIKPIGNAQ